MTRGLTVWLIIMAAETVHGILRGLFLVPSASEALASRIGWPVGAVLVLAIAALLIPWTGLRETSRLLRLGLLWAALTFAFELLVGVLSGLDATRIRAEINPLAGGLLVYSLIVMTLAPLVAARIRGVAQ
jgi:hypothetical protein